MLRSFGFRLLFGSLLVLLSALSSVAHAQPKPVIVFVNGYQDCCAWDMSIYNSPERLGDLSFDLGMSRRKTAWDSFNDGSVTKAFIRVNKTANFVKEGVEFLSKLEPGTDVYLIGHSFGGDSLLSLVTSYRRTNINIRLLAVIDPVSTGGLRSNLDQYRVGKNVEYFYNVWQNNEPFPFDYASDGSIKCDALTCNQRENNFHRNADGSNVRDNCTWVEVGCNGRVENPFGGSKPGWKNKRAGHQGLTTDAFVLSQLQTIIKDLAGHKHPGAPTVPDMPPPPPVQPLFAPSSFDISVKVSKTDVTTVYDSVARVVRGGVAPWRFELVQQPQSFAYFSFDPESGIFIFRPTSTYGIESFKFAVVDGNGQRVNSQVNISFDRSDIFPGHPPLTKTPDRPLPAAINPLITITSELSNESRRLDYSSTETAELLRVTDGSLRIEAEAFLENLDESYVGVLNCTVDWSAKGGRPVGIKDNDDYPKNYFVQQSIAVATLQPYEVTVFRMTCMAPDMPITVKDIPVVYVPAAVGLKQSFDKAEYNYSSTQGGTLKLTLDSAASTNGNRTYKYALSSLACGQQSGTLLAFAGQNKLTINSRFDGVLADGEAQNMVWLNVPVCDNTAPILWKLQSSSNSNNNGSSNAFCQYKHKKDTAGGKNGQTTSLDAFGKTKSCDKNADWKTSCKDGNGDTDEVGCDAMIAVPPTPPVAMAMCQYKHKKDTSGGKSGQVTSLDAFGKTKSCDKNGDWKTSCKDGNGDTDEVACDRMIDLPPPAASSMCQYKHKKDTTGGKAGQVTGLDAFGKTKSCDKNGDWKTSCKDGNGDTDEVACQ